MTWELVCVWQHPGFYVYDFFKKDSSKLYYYIISQLSYCCKSHFWKSNEWMNSKQKENIRLFSDMILIDSTLRTFRVHLLSILWIKKRFYFILFIIFSFLFHQASIIQFKKTLITNMAELGGLLCQRDSYLKQCSSIVLTCDPVNDKSQKKKDSRPLFHVVLNDTGSILWLDSSFFFFVLFFFLITQSYSIVQT